MSDQQPSLAEIEAAAARIKGAVMNTPCLPSETLSAITGCSLFLKFENFQFTASFKERGALNKLLQLDRTIAAKGVCAMSAGNHAQGVAYHAKRLGIPATIVMPKGTPATKITRTRDHDAAVIVDGANLSEAKAIAQAHAETTGATFVHPFDDRDIIAGQGTLGLEILEAVADLDAIVVPIGGGGLISGIAIAAKSINAQIRVIGVQSRTYPSMVHALSGDNAPLADGKTLAEGIAVKTAGVLTRTIVRDFVDEILLVEEATIERAFALLMSIEKVVSEGAGAVGLAAILEHPAMFAGKRVATIVTGGNIDLRRIADLAMRALVRSGQLIGLSAQIADEPGGLNAFSSVLAGAGANIVELDHKRLSQSLGPKGARIEATIEVEDPAHGAAVLTALREAQFVVETRVL